MRTRATAEDRADGIGDSGFGMWSDRVLDSGFGIRSDPAWNLEFGGGDSPFVTGSDAVGFTNCESRIPSSEYPSRRNRPPAQLHLPDDVLLRNHPPMPAVGTIVPMVSHHEVVPLRDDLRSPVIVTPVLLWHVIVFERDVVDIYMTVHNAYGVPLFGDDAFYE